MKKIGIIPARYQSTRYPGKPLIDLHGKSMIQRVYEQCIKANELQDVIVATDDARIKEEVLSFGGHVVMTSDNCKNGTERCLEVIQQGVGADVVINIQGDEPLIDPEVINALARLFDDDEVCLGTMVKKSDLVREMDNPNRIKVTIDQYDYALYFSRAPIPYLRHVQGHPFFYKHIGIYGYRTGTLKEYPQLNPSHLEEVEALEQLRWLDNGFHIKVGFTEYDAISVDAPEDVVHVINKLKDS